MGTLQKRGALHRGTDRNAALSPSRSFDARVSTLDQEPENQLAELRQHVAARGWTAVDYLIAASAERLIAALRSISYWPMRNAVEWMWSSAGGSIRLGRSLKHLLTLLDDLQALGIGFVSLGEGIDTQTPSNRLQLHILGALAARGTSADYWLPTRS